MKDTERGSFASDMSNIPLGALAQSCIGHEGKEISQQLTQICMEPYLQTHKGYS